jgi:hypothetical protein
MKKSLLALGLIAALAVAVLVAQKQQDKPKALAQPPQVVLTKTEYMRRPSGSSSNFFAQPKSRVEADAKTAAAQAETLQWLGFSATEVSSVSVGVKK